MRGDRRRRRARPPDAGAGRYLFGDFCSGKITALAIESGRVSASGGLGLVVPELTSFGVDGARRVYVMSLRGDVYRLDPKPSAQDRNPLARIPIAQHP